ncbi:TetR/AcrR family transcriptional regulator [Spiractinospora alimapuensis]|uniref:TetR/AcrR family transcriptional regulator n=1 Tax=Spiractinospora alimapuensis TaxID=2820884 RepID=UPI001F27215F|nr:TetR/AcrR family transcriptional regulator [Spiractinospora alimapuensis]QVQ52250.1 TetR/AcrR family transcriptional regulator [Spiractinospora alimapuensis]
MSSSDRNPSPARRRILASALLELSERGPRLSYDVLAERAGVNKTTLYRNWPDPVDLIVEALDSESGQPSDDLVGDSAERLRGLARDARERLSGRDRRIIAVVIAAAQNDDRVAAAFHRYWDRRFRIAGTDADAAQLLAAQTLFHVLVLGREITDGDIDRWVAIALRPGC